MDLVGGRAPEFHVIVDPLRLAAAGLSFADVTAALNGDNLVAPAGFHEEDHTLFLTVVDGRNAGYSAAEMFDATHLGRAGALAFSEAVGRVIRDRLDRPESWSTERWVALPRYDARAVATLASAATVEDQMQSGRNLARVMEEEHRQRQERRLAGAGSPGRRR